MQSRSLPMPPAAVRPVHALLDAAARAFGARPALEFLGRRMTYARLADLVGRAAQGFAELGVGKGVRVGLCLPNTPAFVISYYAVLKAGGTVVNFNPLYAPKELEHQVRDSGVRIMVATDLALVYPKLAALLAQGDLERIVVFPMAGMLPFVTGLLFPFAKRAELAAIPRDARHVFFRQLVANRGLANPPAIDPETDLAALQYTGGTTGVSKGAMLTHANLVANAEQILECMPDPRPGEERTLAVLPLFHVFGMTVAMNLGVRLAAEMILVPRFDANEIARIIERQRPTLFPGVPTIYTAISNAVEKRPADLSSIRTCISGGAPLPAEVRTRFEGLTGCRLVEGYGLSECSPVVCVNPLDGSARDGSVGRPVRGTVLDIRPLDAPGRLAEVNEPGELCVRGPQVTRGYWGREDETPSLFLEGALRTGDVGYRDADGFVFLVDRIKDLILCGGYNVYPRAIEDALYQHPGVEEAVVVGVPHAYRGQAPRAFVVLRKGESATPEALRSFLKEHLSPIEMPEEIVIRDSLPKTLVGKLSKKQLLEEERDRLAEPPAAPGAAPEAAAEAAPRAAAPAAARAQG